MVDCFFTAYSRVVACQAGRRMPINDVQVGSASLEPFPHLPRPLSRHANWLMDSVFEMRTECKKSCHNVPKDRRDANWIARELRKFFGSAKLRVRKNGMVGKLDVFHVHCLMCAIEFIGKARVEGSKVGVTFGAEEGRISATFMFTARKEMDGSAIERSYLNLIKKASAKYSPWAEVGYCAKDGILKLRLPLEQYAFSPSRT